MQPAGYVREKELVEFLRGLIAINTVNPPGNEEPAAQYVAAKMRQEGMDVEIMEVSPGRANVVAWLGGRSNAPTLMLNGHLDTVPVGEKDRWQVDPFGAEVKEGRIYGRGASDNKGGVTTIFHAALAVHRAGIRLANPVMVVGVMAEETTGQGTHFLLDRGIHPRQAIVAEWSQAARIAIGYRGRMGLEVETKGKTAHGSRPHQGINAIEQMFEVVVPAIKQYINGLPFTPIPAFLVNGSSASVTMIEGGVKANVIPDACKVQVDIRLAPGQDPTQVREGLKKVEAQIRKEFPHLGITLAITDQRFPFVTSTDDPLVRELAAGIQEVLGREATIIGKTGSSDGNFIVERLRVPVVAYGPGNDTGHAPNEYIEIQDLVNCTRVLATLIPRLAEE